MDRKGTIRVFEEMQAGTEKQIGLESWSHLSFPDALMSEIESERVTVFYSEVLPSFAERLFYWKTILSIDKINNYA